MKVLSDHQLQKLNREEIRLLLLQNDSSHVCPRYNLSNGNFGICDDKDNCKSLHICKDSIHGTCNSRGCDRSHDFSEPQPRKTLQTYCVPIKMVESMSSIYQRVMLLKETKKETNEICRFYVRDHCIHGDKCWRVHFKMPYLWQVKMGETWTDLPNNEDIEREFCNPSNTTALSERSEAVRFDTMTCGPHEVRRLSTASSVVLSSDPFHTTEWFWFWEDEYGKWIRYGSTEKKHSMSSISSSELEKRYQENNKAVVIITAGEDELSFKDMVHKNLRYGTQRPVRRRPKFVSSDDVQTARTSYSKRRGKGVSRHLDKSAVPETGFKRVALLITDREYLMVQELFRKTLSSIEKIQNKELWEDFQTKRERMKVNNKKYGERKFLLFHGTESDSKLIDSICYQNFDCKCGGKGAEYGEGCYFARDALYSHLDTSDHGMHSMFVCRVLVGSYTKGQSDYRQPPSRDGGHIRYDSCVDDVHDPSIYVIFEKQQIYPEYLITYSEDLYLSPPASLTDSSSNIDSYSQSDFPDSSTAFKSMESAPRMVTVATLISNSSVSPSSVVPSSAGRLPSDSLTTTGQSGTSSGTVSAQLSGSDTSAPTVGASSPSSVPTTPTKPSTGSLQSSATKPIPYPRASKSSNLDPATRSQAVSVKPCPPPKPVGVSHFVTPAKEILGTTCTHSAVSEEINPPVSGPAPHNNSRVPSPMPRQVASSSVASDTTAQSSASQGGSDDTTDPSSPERQTPRVSDLINRFNHGKL
ncbi:protein mono-ADP-ribosyltransferase PARP12-like [Alosa pseudoharengus]|uniref:protein mono-ADP-ribosyltransferase PARP12-like n=1 Tax=Alosa pseudoharengus TaxID=34774 RepID=UPI003F8923EE